MLTIRLQRAGKKHQTEFRVVLAEKTAAAGKKFQEVLGNYNPHTKTFVIRDQERLSYWIGQRVAMSPTVHNLFVTQNLISTPKVKAFSVPKKETPAEEAAPAEKAEAPVEAAAEAPEVVETPTEATPETEETPAS
jgi:small subunit ribosomal protein S16